MKRDGTTLRAAEKSCEHGEELRWSKKSCEVMVKIERAETKITTKSQNSVEKLRGGRISYRQTWFLFDATRTGRPLAPIISNTNR